MRADFFMRIVWPGFPNSISQFLEHDYLVITIAATPPAPASPPWMPPAGSHRAQGIKAGEVYSVKFGDMLETLWFFNRNKV
jgi:hypothetical protein